MADEPPRVAELERFLAERGERLLRTAILLTGSKESGEDLLQAALERLFRHWRRMSGDPEGYLRRTLTHLAIDNWRHNRRWRATLSLLHATEAAHLPDATAHIDQRDQLVRLLLHLPARQRAAIVLRYWEELSEAETAEAMGCSVGAVKSATSRGMQRLRQLSGIDGTPRNSVRGSKP
jgi:RNA polymerase sigma-70 factor (sigma-E family)